MLDKTLIKEKFKNSINFYDDNAIIQEKMATKLISLINRNSFNSVLEIGSYSGILTKKIIEKIDFNSYLALDIVDSFEKIKNLNSKIRFHKEDIETFETQEKFDLIIANASLQWCNDFSKTIEKLKTFLTDDGVLAITTFASDNFFEIKNSFNITLDYKTIEEIETLFKNAKIEQEIYTLQFKSANELLKHLKLTGVNAISKNAISYKEIKTSMELLDKKFQNKLTYKPVYIISLKA